ncbi:serine hydrolase domain-containing protein [Pontibacter pamirensis]|uniref:serine hydrolase domain-containing protein n=1 Tax=Pontibacter pamirensis TaxID=2562824 RepID=UPI0013897CD3|nr:serine hydrolase domain-containing protein [Pontibacter pamirensis]
MKQSKFIRIYSLVLLFTAFSAGVYGQEVDIIQKPKTVEELRKAILEVLAETGTPAAGIALVDSEGPVWIEGIGIADREKNVPADEETMFRIGSTSKVFVALAILKLQEQGKLSLKDRVKDLVPEIEFANPWEDTNPILVEHLLEHTTGWDDIHLPEFTSNDPELKPLKEGLAYHPHSRISRWVPGTRMAYANSGPAVAAYIVEKTTGQTYEAYIQENFLSPMGMETMTYFLSEDYKQKGATLYKEEYPQEYWHIIMRPSGAINASPKDMARMLQLFVQRGRVNATQLISESALKRMETPSTTLGAKAGLKYGYGLGLYTSDHNGFTYYKHGGGIGGGVSDFSYLPDYGVGYSVQINAGKPEVIRKISGLIRDYQTHHLPKPEKTFSSSEFKGIARPLNGYYQAINPRNSLPFYLPPLTAERIWTEGDTIYSQLPAFLGETVKFVPAGNGFYHNLHTGRPDFVIVTDPLEGEVLELAGKESGTVTLGAIPGAILFGRIAVLMLWVILVIQASVLVPFWGYRYWKGRIPGGANVLIRVWSLLPVAFLMSALVLFAAGAMDGTGLLAKPNILSLSIMLATLGFFAAAVFSVVIVIRFRNKGIKRSIFLPATFLSGLHLLVAFYLLWHGVIGLRTWA